MTGNDWQVLLYTVGRALLWLVVISACASMYGYFSAFYRGFKQHPRLKPSIESQPNRQYELPPPHA